MSAALFARLGEIAGPGSVETDPRGLPRVAPDSGFASSVVVSNCRPAQAGQGDATRRRQAKETRISDPSEWSPTRASVKCRAVE